MHTQNERGIALVLALFLMAAMSILGASMMFLAQSETYASMNYRMMSQSRYSAEAAIQKSSYFLLDSSTYTAPSSSNASDPFSNYDTTKSPVRYNNAPVVLSTVASESNYPTAAVQTAFKNFVASSSVDWGTLTAGNATLTYKAKATLLTMQEFDSFGGSKSVVQTWQLSGVGSLLNATRASVEVMAVIESRKVPGNSYAAFATANTCAALDFWGNVTTDSYDSRTMSGSTAPVPDNFDGDVGTNGNLTISGNAVVHGNLYTPRTGVGSCTAGNVVALTEGSTTNVDGSVVQLPKDVVYPAPPVPAYSPLGPVDLKNPGACANLGLTAANCSVNGDDVIIDGHGAPITLPEVRINGKANVILVAGTPASQYNFNSLFIASQSNISVKATSPSQAVVVNIIGKDSTGATLATPVDFQGGSFAGVNTCAGCTALCATCSTYDASMLTFLYAGTAQVKMRGNSGASATFYAPNAAVDLGGTADMYGAIVGKTIVDHGVVGIHYDRNLQNKFMVAGQPMLGTFTWKRF